MPSYYYRIALLAVMLCSLEVHWRWKIFVCVVQCCVLSLVGHTQICTYVVVRILCAQDDVHHWEKTGTTFIP